jgi:hypothetical protein
MPFFTPDEQLINQLITMSFIKDQIEKAYLKAGLVCICLDKIDWKKRVIGYVKNIGTSKFKLEIIDEFGQKKSTKTVLFDAVKSLEIGGIYNDNLEKLNKGGWVRSTASPKYVIAGRNDIVGRLNELMEAQTVCTFFFGTEFSIGKVTRITQDEFVISNIADDGRADGRSVFVKTALTKIRWGSNFEKRISFLESS